MTARVNVFAHVAALCESLGVDPNYAYGLTVIKERPEPEATVAGSVVIVELYRGKDGHCQGPKYVDPETDAPATETLVFEVIA